MRVDQLREFGEDLHHLVGALAAGRHHDHFGVALLGDGVLQHRLAATERARDKAGTAFGDRVHRVDAAHARLHDAEGARLFHVAAHRHLDGPFLGHRDVVVFALGVGQDRHRVVYRMVAFTDDGFDGIFALEGKRNHDFVREPALLDLAEPVGRHHLVAHFGDGGEVPDLAVVQGRGVFAAAEEDVFHRLEVVLQTVVVAREQARAEGNLQHMAVKLDGIALLQSAGAFVNLDKRILARDLDDLGHQPGAAEVDVADLVLRHVAVDSDGHEVGNDAGYNTCAFHIGK